MFLYKRAHRTFNLQSSVGLSPNDNANLPGENFHLFGVDNETINAAVDFGFGAANEELCFQFAALISNEDVYTCGSNEQGQLGHGDLKPRVSFYKISQF